MTVQLQGQPMKIYEAAPASGQGPGVLVLHAWWGLNDFFVEVCDRLAGMGFLAAAPDLYQGKIAATPEQAEALMGEVPDEDMRARVAAGAGYLLGRAGRTGEQIGVVGFSMGGHYALNLAAWKPDEVAAVVLCYGAGDADHTLARAAYQGHFAENDPYEPPENMRYVEDGLERAGRPHTFYTYPGAGHWFLETNRPENYNAQAAALAWERIGQFLHEQLG